MRHQLITIGVALGLAVAGLASPATASGTGLASRAGTTQEDPPTPVPGHWNVGWSAVIRADDAGQEWLVHIAPDRRERSFGPIPRGSSVVDLSYDARRIITKEQSSGERDRFTVWNADGVSHATIELPAGADLHVGADDTLVAVQSGQTTIRSATGEVLRTLPGIGGSGSDVTPGGAALSYYDTAGTLDLVNLATGKVVRSAPQPQLVSCGARGLWAAGEFTFWCTDIPGTTNTYTVSAQSGAVTRRGPSGQDLGTVLPTTPWTAGQYWGASHSGLLTVVDGALQATPLDGPWGSADHRVQPIAGRDHRVWATVRWGGDPQQVALVQHDLSAETTTVVAGPGSSGGGVVRSAQTVDGRR